MNLHQNCTYCNLHKFCKSPVMSGKGNSLTTEVILIGESPGEEEDETGTPFVGPAGQFLSSILGDKERYCYLTSIVKCLPHLDPVLQSGVRSPSEMEINFCKALLEKELEDIPGTPVIVTLGNSALFGLIGPHQGITKECGIRRIVEFNGKPYTVIPNYHPSAILRSPHLTSTFRQILLSSFPGHIQGDGVKFSYKTLKPDEAIDYLDGLIVAYNKGELQSVVYDSETTSLSPWRGHPILYTFASSLHGYSVSIPIYVNNKIEFADKLPWVNDIPIIDWDVSAQQREKINAAVKRVIETIPIDGHNLKFDLKFAVIHIGIDLSKVRIHDDTIITAHNVFGKNRGGIGLSLKGLSRHCFEVPEAWDREVEEYLKCYRLIKDKHYGNLPTGLLSKYASLDSHYNFRLTTYLQANMLDQMRNIIGEVTRATIPYTEAETKGVKIDEEILRFLGEQYEIIINSILDKIRVLPVIARYIDAKLAILKLANEKKKTPLSDQDLIENSFNPNSVPQLKLVLFNESHYGVIPGKKFLTKTGEPSTAEDALEFYRKSKKTGPEAVEFMTLLDRFKSIKKVKQDYIDTIPEDMVDGFYKPEYKLTATITGRLSSSFHSMPRRSDVKRICTSRWKEQGGLFCVPDYSQLELRIICSLAKEYKMIDAYAAGVDAHSNSAAAIFKKSISDLTDVERQTGKRTNFAIIFGKAAYSLAEELGITENEAQTILNNFFEGNHNLAAWIKFQHTFVKENGMVTTPYGRIIPVPEALSENKKEVSHGERCGVNLPVQSSGSDTVLIATNEIYYRMKREKMKTLFLGTVHDSIKFDVYPKELIQLIPIIQQECEINSRQKFPWILCPLKMDVSVGVTWGGAIKMKVSDLTPTSVTLRGEALRKDWIQLEQVASAAYSTNLSVNQSRGLKDVDFPDDICFRDTQMWDATLQLSV